MKKIVILLIILFLFVSCGSSSSGADGGVSGWGYYDYFNGHTWSLVVGSSKTSFIFENAKVVRKDFALESGVWVEKYSSTEKPYIIKDWTDAGTHGTLITEDIFANQPVKFTFLDTNTVVFACNDLSFTYKKE